MTDLQRRFDRESTKGKAILIFAVIFFPANVIAGLFFGGLVGGVTFLTSMATLAFINNLFKHEPKTFKLELPA